MKILPLVKGIQKDITQSSIRIKNATQDGYYIADRTSRIYNQGKIRKYLNVTRSVTKKVALGTTKEEIPYVAAAVGFLTPIPFASALMFGLGFLARISTDGAKIIYENISKSNHFKI